MNGQTWEADWHGKRFGGGATFYPYQLSFGVSLRYWRCLFAPSVRVHIGPFKVWIYVRLNCTRKKDT